MKGAIDTAVETIRADIVERVRAADATGVVLGISGGVDSAVVCALCAPVVPTLGLLMPDASDEGSADTADGRAVCDCFGVTCRLVPITPAVRAIVKGYPDDIATDTYCMANIKPRVRMTYLYLAANRERRLVAGTSNKTERLLGYSTKWGDGAADFCPLGDVWKTDVFKLAKALDVPRTIREKPPSARLWPGQTDEGELGGTYAEIDAILQRLEKEREGVAGTKTPLEASLLERMRVNAHKGVIPPFPRVDL